MRSHFTPGFRFSALDAVVLVIGAVAATFFSFADIWIGTGIAFVVLHFFLFCNIFRMSRSLELIWAAAFAVMAILATAQVVDWPVALAMSLLMTVCVVVVEMRRPSYHGIGWRLLNPALPQWWSARTRETDQ